MKAKYSVVITAYNIEKYIKSAVLSVLDQGKEVECIVVDDGSFDGTKEVLEALEQEFSCLKVIYAEHSGVSRARNLGLAASSGEFVNFLDGDDTLEPNTIAKCEDAIANSDLVIFGIKTVDYIGENIAGIHESPLKKLVFNDGGELAGWYVVNHAILLYSCGNKWYRKSIIDRENLQFEEGMQFGEDRIFNYKFLEYAGRVETICDCLYNYNRYERNSLSQKFISKYIDIVLNLHREKIERISKIAKGVGEREIKDFEIYDLNKEVGRAIEHLKLHWKRLSPEEQALELGAFFEAGIDVALLEGDNSKLKEALETKDKSLLVGIILGE